MMRLYEKEAEKVIEDGFINYLVLDDITFPLFAM
jgi:hypothetical protein